MPGSLPGTSYFPLAKDSTMKEKVLLLVDADADCAGIVLEAGARTGHGVRLSRDSREAFAFLHHEFDGIDSLVVDLDPGSHGMAFLEALGGLRRRPPVIVLTALEESHMAPVTARHGAVACLGKPFSIERLKAAIDRAIRPQNDQKISCDPWGHPCGLETEVENGAHA
jgi:DNA-binding NtrC family response regulator